MKFIKGGVEFFHDKISITGGAMVLEFTRDSNNEKLSIRMSTKNKSTHIKKLLNIKVVV